MGKVEIVQMEPKKLKGLTERIIKELSEDRGLSGIVPKLQILSFKLKNKQFSDWLSKETKDGYNSKEELPEYRIRQCPVQANIAAPGGMWQNINVLLDQMTDHKAKELARTTYFYENILEIEHMAHSDKTLKKVLPAVSFHFINETLDPRCSTIEAWQVISTFTCKSIIDGFKSALLDFILKLDEELAIGIDLEKTLSNQKIEKIMNTTINAGVVTTGAGSAITIASSTIVGGVNNSLYINESEKREISKLIDGIENHMSKFGESQDEIKDTVKLIKAQLVKEKPRKLLIKGSLKLLKEIGAETAALSAAPFIIEGIDKVIKLIS